VPANVTGRASRIAVDPATRFVAGGKSAIIRGAIAVHQLSSSARIVRRFSRIGIGAAALTAMFGLAVTIDAAFNDSQATGQRWLQYPVTKTASAPDMAYLNYEENGGRAEAPNVRVLTDADLGLAPPKHSGPFGWFLNLNAKRFNFAMATVLRGLLLTGMACLAMFDFFSGLGWVIARFTRD
jgi:hypothetical protein